MMNYSARRLNEKYIQNTEDCWNNMIVEDMNQSSSKYLISQISDEPRFRMTGVWFRDIIQQT